MALLGAAIAMPATAMPGPEIPPYPPPPSRPGSALDAAIPRLDPWLDMVCPHTGEQWQGRFHGGRQRPSYHPAALEELDWFLRDWRESIAVSMCVRLHWGLAALAAEAVRQGGSGRIELLSGYRTPRTNSGLEGAAANSFHMYGRAVDIRVDGLSPKSLAAAALRMDIGGVGRYGGFVHIDTGRRRSWGTADG